MKHPFHALRFRDGYHEAHYLMSQQLAELIAEYWERRRNEMLADWTRAALDLGDLGPHDAGVTR